MEQEAEYKYRAKEQELLARIDETEAKIRASSRRRSRRAG